MLTSPYVIPSEPFLAAMLAAARRGVRVDLIVDAESNKPLVQLAQQSFYDAMLAAGVGIHRHKGSFLHAKHMSVDNDVALVGSSNLDIRSFALNAEISVLSYDREFVRELGVIQEGYLRDSESVTLASRAADATPPPRARKPGAPDGFDAVGVRKRQASSAPGNVVRGARARRCRPSRA